MNKLTKRMTLSKEIYHELRQQILDGQLAPGSRLIVANLADMLQLSTTPIHEALSALEREGLAIYSPRRGYSVPQMSAENIEEVFAVREEFEVLMARLLAPKADDKIKRQLSDLLAAMDQAVKQKNSASFAENDLAFHRVIWASVGNSLALRIGEIIEGQFRLLISIISRDVTRFAGAHQEHKALLSALIANDSEKAGAAMRTHIQASKSTLLHTLAAADDENHDPAHKSKRAIKPGAKKTKPLPAADSRLDNMLQ